MKRTIYGVSHAENILLLRSKILKELANIVMPVTTFGLGLVYVSAAHLQKALHSLFNAGVGASNCTPRDYGIVVGDDIPIVGLSMVGLMQFSSGPY